MSTSVRDVQLSRLQEQIWEMVQVAVDHGFSASKVKYEVAAAWDQALKDKAKRDLKTLTS